MHYYAQHQLDALDPTHTALEELEAVAPTATQTRLRSILGAFLFSGDDVDKRVAVLSGGEKARVALARMLVRPAALLALDEPTNHLDLVSREVLEGALAAFPGTIVFISHDRYFINRMATKVVEVEGGALTAYLGTYDDYREAKARTAPTARGHRGAGGPGRRPLPRPRGQRAGRELRQRSAMWRRRSTLWRRGWPSWRPFSATRCSTRMASVCARPRASGRIAESQVAGLLREWEELSARLVAHE